MPTIATENKRLSNWLKWELAREVGFSRNEVTINDAAASLITGTVLGKVTATGKYKVAKETATDGSQVPAGILVHDTTVAANTDVKVAIVETTAIVGKNGIILDATYNNDAKKAAAYAALEAKLIKVVAQV